MILSAGWYDNPDNPAELRWWDGSGWTEKVRRMPMAADIYAPGARHGTPLRRRLLGASSLGRPRNLAIAAGVAVVVLLAGGAVAAGTTGSRLPHAVSAAADGRTSEEASSTVTETEAVPFARATVEDPDRAAGTSEVIQIGVDGVRSATYRVTLRNGVEADRVFLSDELETPPVDEITAVGTYVTPPAPDSQKPPIPAHGDCHPSYSGACVPIASDVDCRDGGGNGPEYVAGPVRIGMDDPYGLDRDGDGVACEPWW